eukprot:5399458-Prymnesium_polylepis.2
MAGPQVWRDAVCGNDGHRDTGHMRWPRHQRGLRSGLRHRGSQCNLSSLTDRDRTNSHASTFFLDRPGRCLTVELGS